MKVLHLATSLSGGAGIAALRLHRAMRSQGVDSRMLALRADIKDESIAELPQWKGRLVAPIRESLSWKFGREHIDSSRGLFSFGRLGFDISAHPWVAWADVVYLHWIVGGFLSLDSLERLLKSGKKIRWMMHDMWPITGGCHHAFECTAFSENCGHCPCLDERRQHLASKQLARKAAMFKKAEISFIAPSAWLAKKAALSAATQGRPIAQIPNVLDEAFLPAEDRELARAEFGLDGSRRWALCFASNDPYKGWPLFRDAWNQAALPDDCGLVVCGDENLARELAHPERIRAFSAIRDKNALARLYSAADLFVLPSLAENYPNVAVEALACGTPVLGTNIGGIPEIVEKWGGAVFESNAGSLTDALKTAFCEGLPSAQSETIRTVHSAKEIAKRHLLLS